ncbi:MAG: hypothetical protein WC503_03240 [Candidatus Shapirobacteria bacterium]
MASSNQFYKSASVLVEILIAMALMAIITPAIINGLITSRQGEPQQNQRQSALALLKETQESLRIIREKGWSTFSTNGIYHPQINSGSWTLISGTETTGDFTRSIIISDVYRDTSGNIGTSGFLDSSTKKVVINISWQEPYASTLDSLSYFTRYIDNLAYSHTSITDFSIGTTLLGTQTTNVAGGEVILSNNNYAKWCSPELSTASIDLPDGPPVAVAAIGNSSTTSIPNDVFVAVSPDVSTPVKLAYLTVTADTSSPIPSLQGTFTLDPSKYSNPSYVPTGIDLTNAFRTNDVKYYKSSSNRVYALIATNLPNKEVIAVLINDGTGQIYQDPVNKIYKYWTFFNTRIYQGTATQDETPFGYGGISLAVLENRGYLASGGYLYVFDLSNIDSKSTSNGLDMLGCRIEMDGYECLPGSGTDRKYSAGQTGTTWSTTTTPAHLDCSDGGNIELYANNYIYPLKVGSNIYIFVAVGAGVNPEFNVVNATSIPTSSSSPRISNSSCGRIVGGNSAWKRVGSLDFNTISSTEEAANSVFAKSDGTRAYISSNGGIDSNHDGQPDSYQLYVIDTTNKSAPRFISGTSSPPSSGYYYGSGANAQLFPRRSLTVLNGQRAILVGKDGTADADDASEYQVLNISSEASPAFCGSVNFDQGFNDLTSVSEADGDNFVYMVANTTEKQLKIIQGGPDTGIYVSSGTFESSAFDTNNTTAFNRFSANITNPSQTSISLQIAVANAVNNNCVDASYTFIGPDPTDYTGSYFIPSGLTISGAIPLTGVTNYSNPGRCIKYKTFFSTLDNSQTPSLQDITVNYSP